MEQHETTNPINAYKLHKLAMILIDVSGGFYLFKNAGRCWHDIAPYI